MQSRSRAAAGRAAPIDGTRRVVVVGVVRVVPGSIAARVSAQSRTVRVIRPT
ncbi:MAG: hypothetical protein U0232_12510 [Thermomicrobiales bacterium]